VYNRILTFDHGTSSGWCYAENNHYIISGRETFTNMNSRYTDMFNFALSKVSYFHPDVVGTEQVNSSGSKFGGGNIVTLATMRAMFILAAQINKVPIVEINPSTMKKLLTGYGRRDKQFMGKVASDWSGKPEVEICTPRYITSGKNKGKLKDFVADESDAICFADFIINCVK